MERKVGLKLSTPEQNQSGQTMGSKGLRTRRSIIDTTVALLATTPIRDLKVVDIASLSETSAATFYVYFDSVIDVVLAAAEELSQGTPEMIALVSAPWTRETSHDQAVELIQSYLRFWDEHRPLLRTRNLAAEEGDLRFIAVREKAIFPLVDAMVIQMELAQAQGRLAKAITPFASAGTLVMMLERLGALAHIYNKRAAIPFEQIKEAAAYTVAAAFGWPLLDD